MNVNPVSPYSTNAAHDAYSDRLRASLAEKAAQRASASTDADGDNDRSTSANDKA